MEAIEALMTRRSIRKYTDEPVEKEQIETLLRAAMAAPSAVNTQPWHFVVIRERSTLDRLAQEHPYASMLKQAPLAIAICGDLRLEHAPGYWTVDCGNATENMLIAAHAIGLGAVWLGIYPREERMEMLARVLSLPAEVLPLALVSIGHPAEQPRQPERYNPERVHWESWS